MAIEVISKIKQKNNQSFKLMDAEDVEYSNERMSSAVSVEIGDIKSAVDYVFDILHAAPTLSYINQEGYREGEKKYYSLGESMNLVFSFTSSAAGKCTITILRDGITFKTITTDKGIITVDLGTANAMGSYTYTVYGSDSLDRQSEETLTFTQVLGGVTLSSTFENVIQTTVFSAGSANPNDINIPCSIAYAEANYPREIYYTITKRSDNTVVKEGVFEAGNSNWSSSFILDDVIFDEAGAYSLALRGAIKLSDDEYLYSETLSYVFSVIEANSIAVTALTDLTEDLTTVSTLSITYRVITNVEALQINNALAVKCNLYKVEGTTETLVKTVRATNLTTGGTATWSIGRISTAGTYKYELAGESMSGSDESIISQAATATFEIANSSTTGASYATQGLIAYFNPNDKDNADTDPSVWKQNGKANATTDYYYFKLHDLNYESNGWVVDSTDQSKMLKFTGDSYGELRHVDTSGNDTAFAPMSEMNSAALGNSLEIVFKSRCIGQMDACVMSCRNEAIGNYGGYSVYYDGAKISSNTDSATVDLVEDKETHLVFVIDKNIRNLNATNGVTNDNIENMNPVPTMNIYVNGVRTKVIGFNKSDLFANTNAYPNMQMLLNAYLNTNNDIAGFGSCEIKTIRLYNVALTAEQVLGNYINSKYDLTVQSKLINKNNSNLADIPIVRFVRNKRIESDGSVSYGYNSDASKYYEESFSVLNSITVKENKEDKTQRTSKNTLTNCTLWYTYLDADGNWQTTHFDDVDVFLQGTSSLQYPVKNYKIKLYTMKKGERKKNKIIPPGKSEKDGWYLKDAVFTLKCDYMEESHKNNTPTAMLYEDILKTVVTSVPSINNQFSSEFTPMKRTSRTDNTVTWADDAGVEHTDIAYRDAVAGYPILLYYNENDAVDAAGNPIDYNDLSSDTEGYYTNTNDTMVGTLMWNVDKTGASLGFEVDLGKDSEGNQVTKTFTREDGTAINYTTGDGIANTPVSLEIMPCVSLEGTSNSADPAAAAFYTLDEYNAFAYKNYLELKQNQYGITDDYDTYYANVQAGNYSNIYTKEQFMEADTYTDVQGKSVATGTYKDWYTYIQATFDPRWVWTEEVDANDDLAVEDAISKADYNYLTYGHIKDAIEWVSEASNDSDKFRNEFSQHFDLGYCLTYYLQMMMFAQVDNAGKNAMFDEWGDGIWRPRPYDMDTQMGENNSGEDVIHVSAEINVALSPSQVTGMSTANVSNKDTDASHDRYKDYNTTDSKLWIAFGTYFKKEIVAAYTKLRDSGVYNSDNIVAKVNALTSDIIGESFYNKDAASKYMTQTYYTDATGAKTLTETSSMNTDMLTKLQGNRDSRYEQFMKERIIFLDSFFGYTNEGTTNTAMYVRSNAKAEGRSTAQIGISVYSPCYINIAVGTDATLVAYIDPDETYTYNGETFEGVLFTLPIAANNKDITILGAGNIKSINHMENLVLTNFIASTAKKMTTISITNSTVLAALSLGSNTYLRNVNVSGCKNLTGSLDLSNCLNLQTVNCANTAVTSVSLPEGGSLNSFIATNCTGLNTLTFKDLQFLKTVDLTGCTEIVSYEVSNCPLLTTIDTSGWTKLNYIVINNCAQVTSVNLANTNIATMSITSCDNIDTINLSNCKGSVLNNLNLTTVYGLKNLNISSSSPTNGIILFFPKYKAEYASLSASEISALTTAGTDVYWHTLETLNANSSNLKNIAYGVQTGLTDGTLDFSQLTNLTSLILSGCYAVIVVKDLNYNVANISNLFYNMKALTTVTGTITCTGTKATSVFMYDTAISNLDDVIFNMDTVINANSFFYQSGATYQLGKKILDCLPNVQSLGTFLYSCPNLTELKSDMFSNNPNVTSLTDTFRSDTNLTTIPNGFFDYFNTSLTDISRCFLYDSNIISAPNDLLKNCINITNCDELFHGCSKLSSFFNNTGKNGSAYYYNIFPSSSKITSAYEMFEGCTNLAASAFKTDNTNYGLQKMFDNLPNLQNGAAMFYGTTFITGLPAGVFNGATKLTDINFMFGNNTKLASLPSGSLFGSNLTATSNTHTLLKNARGLFSGCTALASVVPSELLWGAPNLQYIGHANGTYYRSDGTRFYTGGMFANTAVPRFAYNFLQHLTDLRSASMLFYKGTVGSSMVPGNSSGTNATALVGYTRGDTLITGLYTDIFKGLTKLTDVRYCFAGNHGISGFVDIDQNPVASPTLFDSCKTALITAEGLFANCSNFSIDYPTEMFKDCSAVQTLRSAFAGCSSMTGSLPYDFLSGCSSLQNTSYMFYGCSNLGSNDAVTKSSIDSRIFDSCRDTLTNVAYMFAGCGFKGRIGTGVGTRSEDAEGITTYTVTQQGLLANCLNLVSTQGMFRGCLYLKGAIPADMFFTENASITYPLLTNISYMFDNCEYLTMSSSTNGIDGRNKQLVYGDELGTSDRGWFIPNNWLAKCPNIQNIDYLFNRTACLRVTDANYTKGTMDMDDTSFSSQTKIASANYAFAHAKSLNASLSAIFLQNSLNTLTSASAIFLLSNLASAGSQKYYAVFEKNTSETAANSKMTNLSLAFYNANSNQMTGYGPSLSKFTALSNRTSMIGSQTKLSNYSEYTTTETGSYSINDNSNTYTVGAYGEIATLS